MPEHHRLRLLIALALPVMMASAGLWALLQLPAGAQVPIHFDAAGRANGWADACWGLFLLPLLAAGTLGVIWLLPRMDPRAEKLRQSRRAPAEYRAGGAGAAGHRAGADHRHRLGSAA